MISRSLMKTRSVRETKLKMKTKTYSPLNWLTLLGLSAILFCTSAWAGINPTITWSQPAAITYGTPLGPTQLNAQANVPGNFTYSTTVNGSSVNANGAILDA